MKPVSCNRCNSYDMVKGTADPNAFITISEGELNPDGTVKSSPVIIEADSSVEHWTCISCGYATILKGGIVINKSETGE